MKLRGFTLAEVLITLGVIGVVAAITMPTLIQNHQKSVYVNQLKKSYTTIGNGIKMIMADEEVLDFQNTELYSAIQSEDFDKIDSIMSKYFKVVKAVPDSESGLVTLNASGPGIFGYMSATFHDYFLVDGSVIMVPGPGGTSGWGSILDINVDINGLKGPNTYGRDVFKFMINQQSQLVPWHSGNSETAYKDGADGDPCRTAEELKQGYGWACAQRIMAEGWKMNY